MDIRHPDGRYFTCRSIIDSNQHTNPYYYERSLLFCALFALALAGCKDFEEPQQAQGPEVIATSTASRAGANPVFEQMENPYTLQRMRELKGNPSLQPTHFYGRFLPQDSIQLNRLENILDLDL